MVKQDKRFKLRKLPSDRHYLVEENIPLVYDFMKLYLRRYPRSDRQEVESAGMLALVKAATGYKKSTGFAFSTYFHTAAWRECSRLLKYNRDAKDEALLYRSDPKAIEPKASNEDAEILSFLMSVLNEKEQTVIIDSVCYDKDHKEVAQKIGNTKAYVSFLRKSALRKLQWAANALKEREYQLS